MARHPHTAGFDGGFSLVELTMVLSIIAILCAVAIPRYASSLTNYRANAAARRVAADLTLARATAERLSRPATVEFASDGERYELLGVSDPLTRSGEDYIIDLTAEPYAARVESLQLTGGATRITFDGYGIPSASGTLTIGSGSARRVVHVDAGSGRATTP